MALHFTSCKPAEGDSGSTTETLPSPLTVPERVRCEEAVAVETPSTAPAPSVTALSIVPVPESVLPAGMVIEPPAPVIVPLHSRSAPEMERYVSVPDFIP